MPEFTTTRSCRACAAPVEAGDRRYTQWLLQCHAAASHAMIGTRWGRIISISSVSGITGNRGQTNYAAAKSGLHGATKSLSLELASRGITVNAIAPGIIESPMASTAFDRETINRLVPMKRAGTAEEVADLAAFLASDRAAYITGQVISINGGMI